MHARSIGQLLAGVNYLAAAYKRQSGRSLPWLSACLFGLQPCDRRPDRTKWTQLMLLDRKAVRVRPVWRIRGLLQKVGKIFFEPSFVWARL
jgi:hypothetical protein